MRLNAELEFVQSDIFNFMRSESSFDLIPIVGLIAHTGRFDILLPRLKSMLSSAGAIILQTTLLDHLVTRIVRALSSKHELAQRGYQLSWFSDRDITEACRNAGLQIRQKWRHSLGIPFGDRIWPRLNFELEKRLQEWSTRRGADAIYLLSS